MAEPAALDPRPGVLLGDGRYRLDQLIGSGGMATVWRATDRRLGRDVAVKLISEALADDPTYVERFAREARTAAGLSHANLVQVYDYGADPRQPFLVMEYVDGGTLAERLERGPVRGEEAAAVAGDLLSALECIHAAGILHRDVKPANVLLSSDGRARITDFGIAHPEDSTRLTQTGHLVGTLRYLAPEVIDGQSPSRLSDLYALGVLLRDLAGERPDRTTEELVTGLTAALPAMRPRSAEQARRLLREPTSPTVPVVRRRQPRRPAPPRAATSRAAPPRAAAVPAGLHPRVAPRPAAAPRPPAASRPALGARPRHRSPARSGPWRSRLVRNAVILAVCAALGVAAIVLAAGAGSGGAAAGAGSGGAAAKRPPAPARPAATARPSLVNRLDELERLVRAAGQA